MRKTIHWKFTLILLIVGFMIAVQYNSMKNPEERDTTGYLGNPSRIGSRKATSLRIVIRNS